MYFMKQKLYLLSAAIMALGLAGCSATQTKISTSINSETFENISTKKLLVQEYDRNTNQSQVVLLDPLSESVSKISQSPYEFQGYYGENLVFKNNETNQFYRYNFQTEEYQILHFPKVIQEGTRYQEVHIFNFPVMNSDFLLITLATYDSKEAINDFMGTRPAQSTQSYIYSFSADTYEEESFIKRASKILEREQTVLGYSYHGSNQTGQYVYFQLSGEGIGCSSITAVDTVNETVQHIEQIDSIEGIDVGCLYINPDLNVGFYVMTDRTNGAIARLVSLDDLTKPLSEVALTNPKENSNSYFFNFNALEWLSDSEVVLGSDHEMTIIDFNDSSIKVVYTDQKNGQSYMAWDRNTIKFDDNETVAFVDYYSANYKECLPNGPKKCPSVDAADHRYRIILQNLSDNSQRVFLDDATSKHIVGWIEI